MQRQKLRSHRTTQGKTKRLLYFNYLLAKFSKCLICFQKQKALRQNKYFWNENSIHIKFALKISQKWCVNDTIPNKALLQGCSIFKWKIHTNSLSHIIFYTNYCEFSICVSLLLYKLFSNGALITNIHTHIHRQIIVNKSYYKYDSPHKSQEQNKLSSFVSQVFCMKSARQWKKVLERRHHTNADQYHN